MAVNIRTLLLTLAVSPLIAWAQDPNTDSVDPAVSQIGLTATHAVEVCDPAGEMQYLARLVCPSGEHPEFSRLGSSGERTPIPENMNKAESEQLMEDMFSPRALKLGEPDYHITDSYELTCAGTKSVLYLDMYHCSQPPPSIAPPGFTIIN